MRNILPYFTRSYFAATVLHTYIAIHFPALVSLFLIHLRTDLLGWHLRTESAWSCVCCAVRHAPPSHLARPPRPRSGGRCRCIARTHPRSCTQLVSTTPSMRAACDGHRCNRSARLAPADRKRGRACAARSPRSAGTPSTSTTPSERRSMSLHRSHSPKSMHLPVLRRSQQSFRCPCCRHVRGRN